MLDRTPTTAQPPLGVPAAEPFTKKEIKQIGIDHAFWDEAGGGCSNGDIWPCMDARWLNTLAARDTALAQATERAETAERELETERAFHVTHLRMIRRVCDERDAARAEIERERDMRKAAQAHSERLVQIEAFLRPQVWTFAVLMESVLRDNDYKGGWQDDAPIALLERLREEAQELEDRIVATSMFTINQHPDVVDAIGREAADVANFALMIADVVGALAEQPVAAPAAQEPR